MQDFGDVVSLRLGSRPVVLVTRPAEVVRILEHNPGNYRPSASYREIEKLIGQGLVTTDGELWKRHRAALQPAFRKSSTAELVPLCAERVAAFLRSRPAWSQPDAAVDLHHEMRCLMMSLTSAALFGLDSADDAEEFTQAFDAAHAYIMRRIEALVRLDGPTAARRRFLRAKAALHRCVESRIRRQAATCAGAYLLAQLMKGGPEQDASFSQEELRDELLTIFLASYDTTATALTWLWLVLSLHGEVRRRVAEEVATRLPAGVACADDLASLHYTRMVVLETLRLFPPVWAFSRTAAADDVLGGYRIPAGTKVAISPYCTHRHPAVWEDPDAFRPERFGDGQPGWPPGGYLPFGLGPRHCLGRNLALQLMVLVLVMVVRAYSVEVLGPSNPAFEAGIFLKPRHGLPARIAPLPGS